MYNGKREKIMENFRQIDPLEITDNFIRAIGREWMLVTAGDRQRCNTMTASWGMAGEIWGRPAALVVIRPQRYTREFADREERMTLSFFAPEYRKALAYCGSHSGRDEDKIARAGLTVAYTDDEVPALAEARLVLQCRKLYVGRIRPEEFVDRRCDEEWYPGHDYHKTYIVEIERAYARG